MHRSTLHHKCIYKISNRLNWLISNWFLLCWQILLRIEELLVEDSLNDWRSFSTLMRLWLIWLIEPSLTPSLFNRSWCRNWLMFISRGKSNLVLIFWVSPLSTNRILLIWNISISEFPVICSSLNTAVFTFYNLFKHHRSMIDKIQRIIKIYLSKYKPNSYDLRLSYRNIWWAHVHNRYLK